MKRASLTTLALALGLATLIAGRASAQERAAPKAPEAEKAKDTEKPPERAPEAKPKARVPPNLLRVQVVVSRYQGDRKIGSAPYSFLVLAGEQRMSEDRARVRMGVDVPIAVNLSPSTESGTTPTTSYQYKNVGTSIDCRAEDRGAGLYVLSLSVESSSVYTAEGRAASSPPEFGWTGVRPLFRSFNVGLTPVLRDGETIQAVASTDPVSGEVVKIDVTLNVVK
jgi:hypothetical protein